MRPVVALLVATIAVDLGAAAADYRQWSLLDAIGRGDAVSIESAERSDLLVGIGGTLQLLLLVATGIAFLRWFKRAYDDVDSFGRRRRYRSRWAVLAWFVPFLNLWRPKQIANEIWCAADRGPAAVAPIVNWWWGAWLLSAAMGYLSAREAFSSVASGAALSVAADLVDVASAVVAIVFVRRLTTRLDDAAPRPEPGALWPIESPRPLVDRGA